MDSIKNEIDILENIENIKKYRQSINKNQTEFWDTFGLTQPGGSRYEGKQHIPKPTAILMALYISGKITDNDLEEISSVLEKSDKVSK